MNPYFDLCLCVQLDITKAKLSLMTFAFNQVSPSFESISWVNDIYVTKKKTMCFQSGLNTPVLKALVDSMVAAFYKQASDVDRLSDEQRDQFCDQFKTFLDSSEYSNIAEEVLSEFADATRFEHSQNLLDFIQKVIFRLQCFEDTKVKREATIPSKVTEKRPLISTNLILGFFIICFQ